MQDIKFQNTDDKEKLLKVSQKGKQPGHRQRNEN